MQLARPNTMRSGPGEEDEWTFPTVTADVGAANGASVANPGLCGGLASSVALGNRVLSFPIMRKSTGVERL